MNSATAKRPSTIEGKLRLALADKKMASQLQEKLNWDSSQLSRFQSGQNGITIEKIDAMMNALGLVITSREYMDYLAYGSQIGSACECARNNQVPCGALAFK